MKRTVVALVQDRPGVLNRAVSIFRRHGLNIESLTVAHTERDGIARMTWVVDATDVAAVVAQLEKLVEVLHAHEVPSQSPMPNSQPLPPEAAPPSTSGLTQADGIS
jgi:acetolactate synthase-1/3 small subunit